MGPRTGSSTARRNLITRTALIWKRLNRSLTGGLKEIAEDWLKKFLRQAEKEIPSGYVSEIAEMPKKFTQTLQEKLREALAQGYWLSHVYVQEVRASVRGKSYRGKVTLSDIPDDDALREGLQSFFHMEKSSSWDAVIPVEAVNFLDGYIPKLAGNLRESVLEKTRDVLRKSMLDGSTLQERMKALRESSTELSRMTDRRIEAIARTEITRADTYGRLISMKKDDDVIGVEFSAILDDRTTDICESRNGLIMRLDDPRLPENTPPCHVNCLLGDTFISSIGGISAVSERVFDGDIIIVKSARGNDLSGTPNHPILTSRGWVAMSEIHEGDYIVCDAFREGGNGVDRENQQMKTRIKDAANTFFNASEMRAVPVPTTAEDFHNDGRNEQVAIIYTDRKLLNRFKASFNEQVIKHNFILGWVTSVFKKNCESSLFFFRDRMFSPFNSFVSLLSKFHAFFTSCIFHSCKLLFMSITRFQPIFQKNSLNGVRSFNVKSVSDAANAYTLIMQSDDSFLVNGLNGTFPLNAVFEQNVIDGIKASSIFFAKFPNGGTCEIIFDKVVRVERENFSGHVYNLQTETGIYLANNILTHNCRSLLLPLTVYDYPDGLLTSHEIDEAPTSQQRPEDISTLKEILQLEPETQDEKSEPSSMIEGVKNILDPEVAKEIPDEKKSSQVYEAMKELGKQLKEAAARFSILTGDDREAALKLAEKMIIDTLLDFFGPDIVNMLREMIE
mgnify:CR=1 FL=1